MDLLTGYADTYNSVTSDTWTNATLIAAMEAHITSEVTHYKGQCYAWDVVNEALNDDGTYRSNIFYQTIGPQYIAIAFKTAAAADPAAKLYYNDYNIESPGAKATAAQHIVSSLKAQGVKIDGVGLESHFIVGETPSQASQLANMKTFMALGVNVAVTELDVRFSSLPPTTAGLAQQSADYASTVGACVAAGPGCVGITVWDFDDEYSWIPSTFPGEGEADLWNSDLTKKPAYAGVVAALKSGGGSPPSPVSLTTTAKSTTFATSTIRPTTSTSVPATSPTSVPLYGQCGGIGYTGSTVCAIGSTCKVISAYYSQCLWAKVDGAEKKCLSMAKQAEAGILVTIYRWVVNTSQCNSHITIFSSLKQQWLGLWHGVWCLKHTRVARNAATTRLGNECIRGGWADLRTSG